MASNPELDEACKKAQAEDPTSQMSSLCSCRDALRINQQLLKDYIEQSDYYTDAKADYDKYLLEVSDRKNRRDLFESKVLGYRNRLACSGSGVFDTAKTCSDSSVALPLSPKDYWESDTTKVSRSDWRGGGYTGFENCGDGIFNIRAVCKYNDTGKKAWMDRWDYHFPPPYEASEPIPPAELKLNNIMCCDQSFSNISGNQVQFDNVIQDCQLKINQELGKIFKGTLDKVPSAIVKSKTSPPTPSASPFPSTSTTSTTSPSHTSWFNQPYIWVILGGIVIAVLMIWAYNKYSEASEE